MREQHWNARNLVLPVAADYWGQNLLAIKQDWSKNFNFLDLSGMITGKRQDCFWIFRFTIRSLNLGIIEEIDPFFWLEPVSENRPPICQHGWKEHLKISNWRSAKSRNFTDVCMAGAKLVSLPPPPPYKRLLNFANLVYLCSLWTYHL